MLRVKTFEDSFAGRCSAAEKLEDFFNRNNIKAADVVSVSFAMREQGDSDRILLVWNDRSD